jgi:hypothetical protein
MIALKIFHNNKAITTAGKDNLCVLSANLTALGKLGKNTIDKSDRGEAPEFHFNVGGLTSDQLDLKGDYLYWAQTLEFKLNDEIKVKVIDTEIVDDYSKIVPRSPIPTNSLEEQLQTAKEDLECAEEELKDAKVEYERIQKIAKEIENNN